MKNIPIFVRVIVALIVVMTIAGIIVFQVVPQSSSALTASGNVEGVEYKVSPEIVGKISSVNKELGEPVANGETLFTLDGMVLYAQQKVAQSNLDSAKAAVESAGKNIELAQAQYDNISDGVNTEDRALRAKLWSQGQDSAIALPVWYFTVEEDFASLITAQDKAKTDLTAAEDNLTAVSEKSASSEFLKIEKRVSDAQAAYEIAIAVRDQVGTANDNTKLNDEANKLVADAENELSDANQEYSDAMISEGATDIMEARAKLQVAQTSLDVIDGKIALYKTGDRSTKLEVARVGIEQALAAKKQAEQNQTTAQANLDLINAQITKLEIKSPVDGVVQTRNVEVGETVNPGTVVYTILDLSQLSLTVYISEDRYGEISIGQKVDITVDSFPGKVFSGEVVRISDQAEFTPRNVQTSDGRKTTVFAIKIQVDDKDGMLKPGMPADVLFK